MQIGMLNEGAVDEQNSTLRGPAEGLENDAERNCTARPACEKPGKCWFCGRVLELVGVVSDEDIDEENSTLRGPAEELEKDAGKNCTAFSCL